MINEKTTDPQDELLDVVDENDKIIDQATRRECHTKKLRHRTASAFIFDKDWKIFIIQRSSTKDMGPLLWALGTGGHVDSGNNYDTTIKRELKEELNIEVEPIFIKKFLNNVEEEREICAQYYAITDQKIKFNKEEIKQVKFVTFKELKKQIKRVKFTEDTKYLYSILISLLKKKNKL